MADEHTREREFASLLAIPDNYPKYVLSMDDFCMTQSGVDAINIVDWLLGR